jgi:hypothetical protein
MANDIYRIYVSQVFALAKTMVIRSEASAVVTNAYMAARGVAVSDDKRTWRYYMNISGAYHSTNPHMRVTSVDTREEIDFTVENLKIHRATAAEYAYGTKRYKQLLEQYPLNETLILGILNPVDMTTAINAEDGDILWMDMSLVDENELNLKDLIQAEITACFGNRINDYARIEELYEYGRHNIIYAALPMIIINARLENCRTIFAHSFHIRCFLASHGRLDRYMDSMTKLQQLFFYRNLPYLNRNPGQKNIFEWLIKKVLEDRDFPIARYTMNHNLAEMPDSLYPDIEMTRSEITAAYAGIPDESYTVEEVLEKEMYLAESNSKNIDYRASSIQRKLSIAKVGTSQTKVLDSRVVDRSDSQVFSLANTLLTHWLFLSATNRYRAVVRVTNPRSGEEIVLSAKDAFVLFLYAYNRVNYLVLDKIPHLAAVHVRRIPKPALESLMTKVPKYALDDTLVHQIYDVASPVDSYISIASFNEAMNEVYRTSMVQYRLAASQGNFRTRGYATALMEGMYHTVGVDMYDGTPYPAWLKERGLNEIEEFGQFEIEELASELLAVATGSDLNTTVSLSDIHRDMVSIMSQLSSYSIQFVREINTTPLKPIDIRFIKPGDNDGEEDGWSRIDLFKLKLLRSSAEEYGYRELDNKHLIVSNRISSEEENKQSFNLGLDFTSVGYTEHVSRVELPILRLKVPGIQPLIDLGEITEKDHSDIIVTPGDTPDIDLALIYPETDMDGLHLPAIVEVPLSQVFVNTNMDGLIPPEQ